MITMTPKEKAQELVDKIYFSRRYKDGEDYIAEQAWIHAKECALIAVDEVIYILNVLPYGMEYLSHIDYWEGVKQEIEKL